MHTTSHTIVPAPCPTFSPKLIALSIELPSPHAFAKRVGARYRCFIDCLRAAPPQMDVRASLVVTSSLRPLPPPPHYMQTSTSPRAISKCAGIMWCRASPTAHRPHTTPYRLQLPHPGSMCGGRPWPTLRSRLPAPTKNACLVTRSSALPFTPSPQAYAAGGDDNHFHRQHIPLDSGLLHRYLPLLGHSGSKPVRADGTFAALARPPLCILGPP
ncbi:hypothetical protein FIBSPDRAFT_969493 [Athelia psychrophila]|uniref:Uncharacterized protein n=1 Tax=Athelia psychrophila TaxID=1759441 RepID=A0A167TG57_9AGAM|nr:hypothetical protein FIBSPDRAFT_969493 [Fibularhizoctonia sp. CBS 109695]